jgi:hypothetical protein
LRKKHWSKSARRVGYNLEYDCVQYFKKKRIFAFRVPTKMQVGELRSIDVIVVCAGAVQQCKRRKKYLHKPEKERIKVMISNYDNMKAFLCYRDKGLKFERIA